MQNVKSFTCTAKGLARVLITPIHVGAAFDPKTSQPLFKPYVGIWDTGATASAITEKIILECGLKPIGIAKAHGSSGEYDTEVYLVSLGLPNGVGFPSLRVTKGKLSPGSDMLIGMDVIGAGDFAVTNHNGRTSFTFRCPSMEHIDFTGKVHAIVPAPTSGVPKVGRNDPCPCKSGKKYKKCHGSANPPGPSFPTTQI